jgi:HEAT repeat protein
MLLQKYRENNDALKQIGREALAESRRLGLMISAKDRQNETKDQAKRERKERATATGR